MSAGRLTPERAAAIAKADREATDSGKETRKAEARRRVASIEVERADYFAEHYGPLWGMDDEAAIDAIDARLRAAYATAGTPADDRIAGF